MTLPDFTSSAAKSVVVPWRLGILCQAGNTSYANDFWCSERVPYSGDCTELTVQGTRIRCEGKLGQTEYTHGRIGFYFIASQPDGMIVSFSGAGDLQIAP